MFQSWSSICVREYQTSASLTRYDGGLENTRSILPQKRVLNWNSLFWRNRGSRCVRLLIRIRRHYSNESPKAIESRWPGSFVTSLCCGALPVRCCCAAVAVKLTNNNNGALLLCLHWLIRMKKWSDATDAQRLKLRCCWRANTKPAFWRRQFLIRFCVLATAAHLCVCCVCRVCHPHPCRTSWLSAWLNVLLSRSHSPALG